MSSVSRRGYQAPESLVVTAILGLLIGLLAPAVTKLFFPTSENAVWFAVAVPGGFWVLAVLWWSIAEARSRRPISKDSEERSTSMDSKNDGSPS